MKVIDRVLEVENTLTGERIDMGIDQNALAHIMSVLTDLYSDPTLAVIREYSTNALDAHVEAGVTRPIEITLPSALSPYFKVRDFGAGLDVEDIRVIYSQYGASTKRNSDDVVGMLGLGCKSALTYTDQFTLNSVKDGVCTQVAISRDEKGAGSMTIATTFETDEPSGVEIIVPAKKYNQFEEKSQDFFRFWAEGTVLVDGEAPVRIGTGSGLWLTDDLLLTDEADQSYVVMGNVAYPRPNSYNRYATVAFVPIGAVQFTPSREALQMTKLTEAAIQAIDARVESEKAVAVQRLVNDAPSAPEALKVALEASRIFNFKGDLTYMVEEVLKTGTRFKVAVKVPDQFDKLLTQPTLVVRGTKRYQQKGWDKHTYALPINAVLKSQFIVGYDGKDFTPYKRLKLTMWQEQHGDEYTVPEQYILVDKLQHAAWIDPSLVIEWSEIDALKPPRPGFGGQTGTGRPTGSYPAYVGGSYTRSLVAGDIIVKNKVFWGHLNGYGNDVARSALEFKYPNCTVVELSANRIAKFKRDFPSAVEITVAAKNEAEKWSKKLSEEDVIAISFDRDSSEKRRLAKFDPTRIEDPELRKVVEMAQSKKPNKHSQAYEVYSRYSPVKLTGWVNPIEKYPLLTDVGLYGTISGKTEEHLYLYLNAAHAAEEA